MDTMLECVRMSHSNAWSKDPMMQLKITALLSPELCVRLPNQSPQSLILLFFRTDARGDFKLFFLSGWVGGGISEYSGCMGTGVLTSEASNVWEKR